MTTPNPRTKTGRKQIARQARRHGYYDRGSQIEVTCPLCRERVRTAKPIRHLQTITSALDEAMDTHLQRYCEQAGGADE